MDSYEATMRQISVAFGKARLAANALPELPEQGCPCGADDLLLEQYGFAMWNRVHRDEDGDGWNIVSDGWDAVSETGDGPAVIWCQGCDTHYQEPNDTVWV